MLKPLDPDAQSLIDDVNAATQTFARSDVPFSPSVLRESVPFLLDVLDKPKNFPSVDTVEDDVIVSDGRNIPVRRYRPGGPELSTRTVVTMHGGGWMVGDLDAGDLLARYLCAGLHAVVVSIDYALAPEHPFPSAFEDCSAVLRSIRRSEPRRAVGVAGDSAGGNLAAALALAGREDPELATDAQLLIYPALDPTQAQPSHDRLADGYLLTRDIMTFYWFNYLQGTDDRQDPRAAPIVAEKLDGAPPAVIVTAGFDPLQDEGRLYAERLTAAGTDTVYLHEPSMLHGFVDSVGRVPAARAALLRLISAFDLLLPGAGPHAQWTDSSPTASHGSVL